LSATPLDLVDFLFDFEGFEVVELRLVRLELGVELVFASFFVSFLSNNTTRPPLSPVAR